MTINDTSKVTNLTKKAIEYYTEQKLVFPSILENGYRDYGEEDLERLKKIYILRKLGLGIEDIKTVLNDGTGSTLQKLSVQKELQVQRDQVRKTILNKLSCGKSYAEIYLEIKTLEQSADLTEKLLEAFPGYYGRFICLHFARFLNEPIVTEEQQDAYRDLIEFLDNTPKLEFPDDVQKFFDENTKQISTESICSMIDGIKQSIENPDKFFLDNEEFLKEYLVYKQSEEYRNSPAYQLQNLLKSFNSTSGYNDILIPAMIKLSSSYSEYHKQLKIANDIMLLKYPELAKISLI